MPAAVALEATVHGTNDPAREILRTLFRRRRHLPPPVASPDCETTPCDACFRPHLQRVERFVASATPVHMVLPAFPAKSPSRRKVLGTLPDMAEEVGLLELQRLCDDVGRRHPAGARITICSDGRVFSDLVGVGDDDVTRYGRELARMIRRLGLPSLAIFSLDDLGGSREGAMAWLAAFADPLPAIAERAAAEPPVRALWCGLQRFLFEDRMGTAPRASRSQVRRACGALAYRVMQRSQAWGRLVACRFPEALRLSIHPQPVHGEKIGVLLGEADDRWVTPWHAVALRVGDGFRLLHRRDAEELGARLVDRDGRPSHYEIAC